MAAQVGTGNDLAQQFNALAEDLERQELESAAGIATPTLYGQLLAIYLYQSDLTNAKFLWKRIPQNIKEENPELEKVWQVGKSLWNHDVSNMYRAISDEWPEHLKPIMEAILDKTCNRTISLAAKAYSSVNLDYLPGFIGLPMEEVIQILNNYGWEIDMENRIVKPKKSDSSVEEATPSEEQLAKLTEFVSFLEN